MTKHFVLSIIMRDGKRNAICADNTDALLERARKIRDEGKLDGKPVRCGVVMSTVRGVVLKFACRESIKPAKAKDA
jgi:hypothetical protein